MKLIKITAMLIIVITLLSTVCYATSLNLPTIDNYDEYKEYIKEHKNSLPEDFVHYRSFSALGEFTQFSNIGLIKNLFEDAWFFQTGGTRGPIADYQYTITDKNGYEVQVKAYHDDDISLDDVVNKAKYSSLSMDSVTDLRHHPSGEDGLLEINDCYYRYLDGKLRLIAWRSREVIFTLTFDMSDFDGSHDDEKTTLVTRLLDPDTAKSATRTLKRIGYRNLNYEYPWLLPLIIVLATLIIVTTVVIILYFRKKKRKTPADNAETSLIETNQKDPTVTKKTRNRLRIIILSALILIMLILLGIWIWYGRSLGVHSGMSSEDYIDKIPLEDRFEFLQFSFYENTFGGPVVVRFNSKRTVVEDIKIFSKWGVDKSPESFKEIKKGMDLYDVIAKVGVPTGSATFGMLSTIFVSNDGTKYCVYWDVGQSYDSFIVSDIVVMASSHPTAPDLFCPIPIKYFSREMESFLTDWFTVQTYSSQVYSDPAHKYLAPDYAFPTTSRLTIPILSPEVYAFWAVEVDERNYCFRYVPIEDAGIQNFDLTDGITITVTKADVSFDQVASQNDWEISDGTVYLPKINKWYTHHDGKLIDILLPKTIVLENADALDQLLSYTTYVVHNEPY